jgi:hypothetical protein
MVLKMTTIAAAIFATAMSGRAETIDVPKGTKVDFATVAKEAKKSLPSQMTVADFKARLKEGGTFSLGGGDLVLAPANFAKDTTFFLALDTLELKNGARIVTNGNTLVVFANKVVSEDGGIAAFRDDEHTAANGGLGEPGSPGVPGRLVSFHVIQQITGILHVDLTDQTGGKGGDGRQGIPGVMGVKGDPAIWDPLPLPPFCNCRRGGGGGSPGSAGGTGERGRDGGNGGSGGILELINVGATPIPAASYTFKADAGQPGGGGSGGPGGPGGEGGLGGDGGGCCGNGPRGAPGATGQPGGSGNSGSVPNPGQAIVKNLDLEFIVKHIGPASPLDPKASSYFNELK